MRGGVCTISGQVSTGIVNLPAGARPPATLPIKYIEATSPTTFAERTITINANGNVSADNTLDFTFSFVVA